MDSNRTRKREDGSPSCVVIFVITPICKTFEGMGFPSIKRYRISGAGALHGDETSKRGFTFLTHMLGNLLAKKNKITCNTE